MNSLKDFVKLFEHNWINGTFEIFFLDRFSFLPFDNSVKREKINGLGNILCMSDYCSCVKN